MRRIGDPRANSILARLPERGLRGCAILAPNIFLRSSYSGAAGRGGAGRGIGSAQPSDEASGASRRDFLQEEIEKQWQSSGYPDAVASGDLPGQRNVAQTQSRVGPGAVQQQGGSASGRGRGAPHAPQQQETTREEKSVSSGTPDRFGRGRGSSLVPPGDSGQGRRIFAPPPPPLGSRIVGREIPLGSNVDTSEQGTASLDGVISHRREISDHEASEQGRSLDPFPSADESKQTAVQKLLFKLSQNEAQVAKTAQSSAPAVKPKLPFRMPFARPAPAPAPEQRPVSSPLRPLFPALASSGRGSGQPGAMTQPGIGAESEVTQESARRIDMLPVADKQDLSQSIRGDRVPDMASRAPSPYRRVDRVDIAKQGPSRARQGPSRPASPPRMQLSAEEARARAMAILEAGIEKNKAAEGERRRKAGMEKFADASEFFADRLNRTSGQSAASPRQEPGAARQTPNAVPRRQQRPRRQRSGEEVTAVSEASVEMQLTPEQEAELVRIQEEDTFKDRLHTLFLTQFEPEFAMEEFGRNPDIDEAPVLSLEEYLQSYKPMFLHEKAELSQEQKWQEAVKVSLANAPDLEKLVEAYAGPGRLTARQQIEKLQTIYQKLPPTVSSEVAAFTKRAFLTLQNNPSLRMHHKEKLMTKIVSGFS